MKKTFSFLIIISVILGSLIFNLPVKAEETTEDLAAEALGPAPPEISAESAVVMDASTGQVVYEKNAYARQYPASITKILTCYLAIKNCLMTETITMSDDAVWGIPRDSSHIALDVGEQISMEDALYAVLLVSANEAAWAVGEHVSGSLSAFVDLMNETASSLGCKNTHFANANGLHDDDHYTCAYDMALIAKQALTREEFRHITSTMYHEIAPTNKNDEPRQMWQNNRLIDEDSDYYYPPAEGGKTGYTDEAQNTLVTWAKKDGMELVCVVMKEESSGNSYEDSISLYDYVFDNFSYRNLIGEYQFDGEEITRASNYLCDYYNCENAGYMHLAIATASDALMSNEIDASKIQYQFETRSDQIEQGIIGDLLVTYGGLTIKELPVSYSGFVRNDRQEELDQAEAEGRINPAYNLNKKRNYLPVIVTVIFILLAFGLFLRFLYIRQKRIRRIQRRMKR